MKRLLLFWILACLVAAAPAQQTRKKSATSKTSQTSRSGKTSKSGKARNTKKSGSASKKKSSVTVNGLKNEQAQVRQQIKEQERRLKANELDVKKRLQKLMVINNEIVDKRRTIDTIRGDITRLDGNIHVLEAQLKVLERELDERKQRFSKSMRYMHCNRSIQSQMMFIFSAKNFSQMYRRLRFVREYAAYQKAQGEAVEAMQTQVAEAFEELKTSKRQKNDLLYRGEQEKRSLENKQVEQEKVVNSLKKQQKTIISIIDKQKKRDAELNAQIDRMIAEEIARAKARAEAEAKRKAEEARRKAEAEAAKKRAEELARKKAEAEAAARENARRIAEAKAREEKAKAEARAAAKKTAEEKAAAERAAREAEKARLAAERKAKEEARAHEKEVAAAKKSAEKKIYTVSSEDQRLSGNFESNRGRLPMPVSGGYQIVHRFGTNHVDDVKGHVTLDKKGIDIKAQPGSPVRCIFDGEVSAVFGYAGTTVVIIRHGNYLSVYCDLASVSVSRGQKVSARQTIGRLGSEGLMQFQLRRGNEKLNPEGWLSR